MSCLCSRMGAAFARLLLFLLLPLSAFAFGPVSKLDLLSSSTMGAGGGASFQVTFTAWSSRITYAYVELQDTTGTRHYVECNDPAPIQQFSFHTSWQWLNGRHSISRILVLDAAGYGISYEVDGSVWVFPPPGGPALPGTPVHDFDFPSKFVTISGGLDALDATRVDAIHLLTSNTIAVGGSFSCVFTYYLGTLFPKNLRLDYVDENGVESSRVIDSMSSGPDPFPAWNVGQTTGKYTLRRLTLLDRGLRTYIYERNGTIDIQPGLPGASTTHSLDLSMLDYTVVSAPPNDVRIDTQPASASAAEGSQLQLRVVASGTTLNYQWSKNGVEIFGAIGPAYGISPVRSSDAGKYTVRVYNTAGGVTSETAVVTVLAPVVITGNPYSQEVQEGDSVTFSVEATGAPSEYQWYKDDARIAGATSSHYTLPSVLLSDAGTYRAEVRNEVGSVLSSGAVLTVKAKPVPVFQILTQPLSQEAEEGARVVLSVAGSRESLAYQWCRDGVRIAGATTKDLVLDPVRLTDAASYSALVSDGVTTLNSDKAALVVRELAAVPRLLESPKSETVQAGKAKVLSVSALGGPLTYQWYRNGKAIAGATTSSLTLAMPSSLDGGEYTCALTNKLGTTTTQAATLSVSPCLERNKEGRVANLSSRVLVGKDNAAMIAGFSIEGTQPKTVLLRASGPALAPFGVANFLPDPVLRLHDMSKNGEVVASNEDWDAAATEVSANAVGAFGWAHGSKDAALLVTLNPGLYSAEVLDHDFAEGVALIEVYEVGSGAKCVNISTRSIVGTAETAQVAGFVIQGPGVKTVLLRASGPALAAWMDGTVPDPVLEIRDEQGMLLFSNDNWSGDDIANQAAANGAFAWKAGSLDAALLVSLPEGHYTAVVQDRTGARGIGLVEIYEVNK